ncbi:hypothetical protein A3C87_04235 [Candidatus Kaiserbacteria bacterium RIFCSPHIGHO2_02_FULL_49_34]|uniref:Uncharacterized protein n=1 Tax=Candidatus Kaiserbacteria bacterium RIFCSPHIGHO2_02_FULL_49_34 TaxID=1798491 RepID=A0A1F6DK22_9BACT|nr:MAG: hypothetical protein A3C87_04235 [Candidatus Kaiserbacteria bacterium RIFCSPHIGHO2_02_FULL_49_34]
MNSKNLIVLALVGVVVLTGALIVSTSDMRGGSESAPRAAKTQTPRSAEGTQSGEAAQTSVEIVSDNVETKVEVQ